MDIRKLWLDAADSLVMAYLEQANNGDFNKISVLSALEHTSDALYHLDHGLALFISGHARRWFEAGMIEPANFATEWYSKTAKAKGDK